MAASEIPPDDRTASGRPPTPSRHAEPYDVAVVGAGISGLAVAFHLARAGRRVAVLEASEHLGGAIVTHRRDRFLFELGPNTVLENRSEVGELIRDAGLEGDKIEALPEAKKRFLWKGGELVPLPGGPPGFLKTPLFSWKAKLRLAAEPFIRRAPEGAEESIAGFVRRRLGAEMLDYAVGPFVSGVYAGDPERLSVRWATRKIWDLEHQHGSLIRGAIARRKGPAPGGAMISFRDGLDTLPAALADAIRSHPACRVSTGARVTGIDTIGKDGIGDDGDDGSSGGGPGGGYRLRLATAGGGGAVSARRLVTAIPADVTAKLLEGVSGGRSRGLAEIPYAPVVTVALGFERRHVRHPLDGFGFLAPRVEALRLLGCLFPSSIFPGRAPEEHVALSAFLGGRTDPGVLELSDREILQLVLEELDRALGLEGEPVVQVLRRWPRAIPQYEVGHGRFVELAKALERDLPGLHVGGNFLHGISVPDCIGNARRVACEMLEC